MRFRPTEAVVDLAAIAHNCRLAAELASRPVIGVVKADGYGHGAIPVARALLRAGAPALAVALVEEAVELREAGIGAPVLVLGGARGAGAVEAVRHHLTPLVASASDVAELAAAARARGERARAHLKLDTGMARVGVALRDLPEAIEALRAAPEVALEGVCTHLARSDELDRAPTLGQVRLFDEAVAALAAGGLSPLQRHLANSGGTVAFPEARQDLVRVGIMLYGYLPFGPEARAGAPVSAAAARVARPLRWSTAVVQVRTVPAGTPVSYGGHWKAPRPSRIAVLPVGYADGYSRRLSGRPGFGCGQVLVRGRRAPVAGTVCMDWTMVDVTGVPGVVPGDEVVLLGDQGGERIDADELAERAGTIPYEILCAISRRVPRRYLGEE